LTQVAWAIKL